MRIKSELLSTGLVICKQNCIFKDSCAQHYTAGDYRSEGGFSPELFEENGVFYCRTQFEKLDMDVQHETLPENSERLGTGYILLKNGRFVPGIMI